MAARPFDFHRCPAVDERAADAVAERVPRVAADLLDLFVSGDGAAHVLQRYRHRSAGADLRDDSIEERGNRLPRLTRAGVGRPPASPAPRSRSELAAISRSVEIAKAVRACLLDEQAPLGAHQLPLDLHGVEAVLAL